MNTLPNCLHLTVTFVQPEAVVIRLDDQVVSLPLKHYSNANRRGVVVQIPASHEHVLGGWPYSLLKAKLAPHFNAVLLQTRTGVMGRTNSNAAE